MILGPKSLLKLVKSDKLVENLSERELTNPEGAGFDLRLGEIYKITGKGFLGIEERNTPEAKLLKVFDSKKNQKYTFEPGKQYLVSTLESVNLPLNLTANFWLRSTLYRSGMILSGGNVAPGYSGKLSFTFFNSGLCPITIELGARIIHILFYEIDGGGNTYRGQWKNGRVFTTKKEKQI